MKPWKAKERTVLPVAMPTNAGLQMLQDELQFAPSRQYFHWKGDSGTECLPKVISSTVPVCSQEKARMLNSYTRIMFLCFFILKFQPNFNDFRRYTGKFSEL